MGDVPSNPEGTVQDTEKKVAVEEKSKSIFSWWGSSPKTDYQADEKSFEAVEEKKPTHSDLVERLPMKVNKVQEVAEKKTDTEEEVAIVAKGSLADCLDEDEGVKEETEVMVKDAGFLCGCVLPGQ